MKRVRAGMIAAGSFAALAALLGPLADDRIKPGAYAIPRSSRSDRTKKHGAVAQEYMSRRARRRARGREKAER